MRLAPGMANSNHVEVTVVKGLRCQDIGPRFYEMVMTMIPYEAGDQ